MHPIVIVVVGKSIQLVVEVEPGNVMHVMFVRRIDAQHELVMSYGS